MKTVEVKTQGELDEALKAGNLPILVGNGSFVVQNSSRVEAWGSSHVVAWESSSVLAWESSSVLALKAEVQRLRDEAARVRFGQATEVRTPLPEDSAER